MKRFGMVIKLRSEKVEEYRSLHEAVWPEVLAQIEASHIRNYSIFYHEPFLFSYFEYVGSDFAVDMAAMAADPKTQEWWRLTDPCQEPVEPATKWKEMEEMFHID